MRSTPLPKSASNQTAQPPKTAPAWSSNKADALRGAVLDLRPGGACNCYCGAKVARHIGQ